MKQIYLDNSATTKICKEALEKYIEISKNSFGNPSSLHALGFEAEKIIDRARGEICAALVGWSGFSVHLQMIGLCDGVSLSFRPYFLARLLQGILNFILVFLWLRLF